MWTVSGGEVAEATIDPTELGIPRGTAEGLRGGDAAHNADVVRRLLGGERGPVRDAVVLNAGAALAVHAGEDGSITERLVAVYDEFGLSEGEFDVLATLRRAGAPFERGAGELADHTLVTTGGLTKRVDRLAARGLVERRAEASDARKRLVRLTPEGRDLIDRAIAAHLANERRILDDLGTTDAAALEQILTRWLRVLDQT